MSAFDRNIAQHFCSISTTYMIHMCIIYVVEMLQKCCAMLRSKADMLLCKFSPIYVLLTVHFSVFFETLLLQ